MPKPFNTATKSSIKQPHGTSIALFHSPHPIHAVSELSRKRGSTNWKPAKILLLAAFVAVLAPGSQLPTPNSSPLTSLNNISMPEKEPTPRRIDLFNADVMQISDCSQATASRKMKECKDALGKKEHQQITIREYCSYWGYDYLEVIKLLQLV
jgi:hypothetical protein